MANDHMFAADTEPGSTNRSNKGALKMREPMSSMAAETGTDSIGQ